MAQHDSAPPSFQFAIFISYFLIANLFSVGDHAVESARGAKPQAGLAGDSF